MDNRRGFTLTELLCVIAITGILVGLSLPAVQNVRESARDTECSNRIRQIGLAALNYRSTKQKLPPGTLGFADVFDFSGNWFDESSEYYWKGAQHTSSLGLLLPFIENGATGPNVDRIVFAVQRFPEETGGNWLDDVDGFTRLCGEVKNQFRCPSDTLNPPQQFSLASQPCYQDSMDSDAFALVLTGIDLPDRPCQMTSYLACSGAASGGEHPDSQRARYRGAMGSRVSARHIPDGESNTILFGETLGEVSNGRRSAGMPWTSGGLARGRGGVLFLLAYDSDNPEKFQLGNPESANLNGFGSSHRSFVNFVFADGSVRGVSTLIHWRSLYAMCGVMDGETVREF